MFQCHVLGSMFLLAKKIFTKVGSNLEKSQFAPANLFQHLEIRTWEKFIRRCLVYSPSFTCFARGIYYTTPEEYGVMDSSGIADGGGTKAQLLGREYVDDWIKKKPPMSWFCTIFAFYEVGRHNNRRANIYIYYMSPADSRERNLSEI